MCMLTFCICDTSLPWHYRKKGHLTGNDATLNNSGDTLSSDVTDLDGDDDEFAATYA